MQYLTLKPNGQYLQLNTPGQGKAVVFAPNVQEEGKILVKAANRGSYYPQLVVKHLGALSTGLTGKTNVFIPNINDFQTNSLQKVVVFVAGIAATVERRPNDMLVITQLMLSDGYDRITKIDDKPGIYSVTKVNNQIQAIYRSNGRIVAKDERKVVIADAHYSSPTKAAEEAAKRLDVMLGGNAALKCDFDILFSPSESKLNGMRNYNPAVVTKAYGFASILANAMEQAKEKTGVEWVSERTGALILTQALMALAAKNISFDEKRHILKMCWATCNTKPAYDAATQMGMLVDKNL